MKIKSFEANFLYCALYTGAPYSPENTVLYFQTCWFNITTAAGVLGECEMIITRQTSQHSELTVTEI